MIPLLLAVIAIVSYLLGNINAMRIVSRIFQRQLPNYSGERALAELNRVFGVPGVAAANIVDAAKAVIGIALLLGHLAVGAYCLYRPGHAGYDWFYF